MAAEHVTALRPLRGDRWRAVTELIGDEPSSVVDIGCRDKRLRDLLPAECRYVGMDLFPPADVLASAEEPLPFEDGEFDVAVLADVLEHLNDPHSALDEAMRVARKAVVIFLPNMYSLWHRVQYLRGVIPDKYDFGPEGSLDRHRWLMDVSQSAEFAHGRAERNGWRVADEAGWDREFRRLPARAAYGLARRLGSPDVWAWGYAARLEPRRATTR